MSTYVLAFLIGVVAGLRSLTPPAAVSWGARLGWLHLENTWLAFLGSAITPYILSALAIGELINDKLPKTPSRKAPPSFAVRVVIGALCGAALGAQGQGVSVQVLGVGVARPVAAKDQGRPPGVGRRGPAQPGQWTDPAPAQHRGRSGWGAGGPVHGGADRGALRPGHARLLCPARAADGA